MNFDFLSNYYMFFLDGAKITLLISFFTVILGTLLGVILALTRLSKKTLLNKIFYTNSTAYVEFIRGTPLLVQLFIIYYGLPQIGIDFSSIFGVESEVADYIAGIITLSMNSGAYVAEIVRAGIQSVDKGQMEAARSLGMNERMAMRSIILPQAFKRILPALGNEFIVVIKESSIVSIIGIHELMYNADTVRGNTYQPFEPLIVAAFVYFIMTFTLSKILGIAERKMKISD